MIVIMYVAYRYVSLREDFDCLELRSYSNGFGVVACFGGMCVDATSALLADPVGLWEQLLPRRQNAR
jgi:hypothetical protein